MSAGDIIFVAAFVVLIAALWLIVLWSVSGATVDKEQMRLDAEMKRFAVEYADKVEYWSERRALKEIDRLTNLTIPYEYAGEVTRLTPFGEQKAWEMIRILTAVILRKQGEQ